MPGVQAPALSRAEEVILIARWPYNTTAWKRVRLKVLKRDGYECQLRYPCCTRHATSADHTIPVSHLERRDPAVLDEHNLVAACGECNSAKRNRLGHPTPKGRGTRTSSRRPRRIPAATNSTGARVGNLDPRPPTPTPHPTTREW